MLTIDQSARIIDPTAQALRALRSEAEETAEAAELRYCLDPADPHDAIDAAARVDFIREALAKYVASGGDVLAAWDRCARYHLMDLAALRARLAAKVEPERMAA